MLLTERESFEIDLLLRSAPLRASFNKGLLGGGYKFSGRIAATGSKVKSENESLK